MNGTIGKRVINSRAEESSVIPQRGACARILADTLYSLLEHAQWFTPKRQAKFFAYFLHNLIDGSIEAEVDARTLDRLRRIPLRKALNLLDRYPNETNLQCLVALIFQELRDNQGLDAEAQREFYSVLFNHVFDRDSAGALQTNQLGTAAGQA